MSINLALYTFERQLEAEPDPQQLTALKALLERPAPWD